MGTATTIPNMNPTGVIGSGAGNTMPGQGATGFSAWSAPGTGGPGNMGFGNAANPVAPMGTMNPAGAPITPAGGNGTAPMGGVNVPGAVSPGGGVPNFTPSGQSTIELQNIYGKGMGDLIAQYLASGGGFNSAITQEAVNGQINGMGQQIQLGANNLTSMLGAMGVSGSSSEMGTSLTNYENQATTQENAITSQEYYNMWNQSQSNELSLLKQTAQDAGTYQANKSNWLDYLKDGLEVAGAVAML